MAELAGVEDAGLPVHVELPEPLGVEVRAWVEADAGWQLVAADGPPTPVLHLRHTAVADRPCVVVREGPVAADLAAQALAAGAVDVIAWPDERERLRHAPLRVRRPASARRGPRVMTVAGTAGGAGTSTVALALGGLLAWSGHRVLMVGREGLLGLCGHLPWRGPGSAELAALDVESAAAELPRVARPIAGVRGLEVVAGSMVGETAGWPHDAVVIDVGVAADVGAASVVVSRADATLQRARACSRPVVVSDGGLSDAEICRVLGRRSAARLPYARRAARAGLAGRVPSALPGRLLAALRPVLAAVAR